MKKSFLMAGLFAALLVFTACQQAVQMQDIKFDDIEWSEGVWKVEQNNGETSENYKFYGYGYSFFKVLNNSETGYYDFYSGENYYLKRIYEFNDAESYNEEKNLITSSYGTVVYDDEKLTITLVVEGKIENWDFAFSEPNISSYIYLGYMTSVQQSKDKSVIIINNEKSDDSKKITGWCKFTKQ